jgi:cation diffusion facilitator family transporter
LAYSYVRKHAADSRFTFGTGKLGDLAGFTSAVILAMIALLIGYEAISRFIAPVPIHFAEAIPIACLGLAVNVASAWLLSSGGHHHHGHGHAHGDEGDHRGHDEEHRISTPDGVLVLSVFEENHPPVFRIRAEGGPALAAQAVTVETIMRAAVIHVMADAAVSVLVIIGLLLARAFGWLWMDPLAGIVGAFVIASWSYGLIRDTGAILLDMNPDSGVTEGVTEGVRQAIEQEGDCLTDLHVWGLGPGHPGAIVSVETGGLRDARYYRGKLARIRSLSHVTVEVDRAA